MQDYCNTYVFDVFDGHSFFMSMTSSVWSGVSRPRKCLVFKQTGGLIDGKIDWRLKKPHMGDNMEITHIAGIYRDIMGQCFI